MNVGEGLLAMAGPNYGADETAATATYQEVFLAGRDQAAVDYLKSFHDVQWDWTSWTA